MAGYVKLLTTILLTEINFNLITFLYNLAAPVKNLSLLIA
jgi:hypothetical protein